METKQEQLTQSEKINLGIKEITRLIREQLKKEFPSCKFSVTMKHYSSVSICLMESNYNMVRRFEDISDMALFSLESRNYKPEDIKQVQLKKYHQLNHYSFLDSYNPNSWNNGVFLTEKCHRLFKKIVEITSQYNYDNSDISTDYFDTNFYLHLSIGEYDKEYKFKEDYKENI